MIFLFRGGLIITRQGYPGFQTRHYGSLRRKRLAGMTKKKWRARARVRARARMRAHARVRQRRGCQPRLPCSGSCEPRRICKPWNPCPTRQYARTRTGEPVQQRILTLLPPIARVPAPSRCRLTQSMYHPLAYKALCLWRRLAKLSSQGSICHETRGPEIHHWTLQAVQHCLVAGC